MLFLLHQCRATSIPNFEADILRWKKERKNIIIFVKQVLDASVANSQLKTTNSSRRSKESQFATRDDEDEVMENIGKIVDILRQHSLPSLSSTTVDSAPPGNGVAFFPIFSLIQHSCISNAKYFVYPDNNLAVQAQRPISAGEEITISRVHTLEPTWKRRARLYRCKMICRMISHKIKY